MSTSSSISVPRVSPVDPQAIPLKAHEEVVGATGVDVNVEAIDDSASWTTAKLPKAELLFHVVATKGNPSDDAATGTKTFEIDSHIDALVDGLFTDLIQRHQFSGKEGKSCSARVGKDTHFSYAAIMGLGSPSTHLDCETPSFIYSTPPAPSTDITPAAACRLGKTIAASLIGFKTTTALISLKDLHFSHAALHSFLENFFLGLMVDDRFKSKKGTKPPVATLKSVEIRISSNSSSSCPSFKALVSSCKTTAAGIDFAKQLTTAPPNYCNPVSLASTADQLAKSFGMKSEILNMKELEDRKMGAFVAVGKGSFFPPHLIHLTYSSATTTSTGASRRKLAFVGKGLTMDTGGYNLKVNGMIELMKWDMGGAAAVLGAARVIGESKPPNVEIHFIVGAAENMISSKAYRPGDVITASNGITIEVGNTDAEGRLVLCDCLVFAESLGVDFIMDMATLTGSSMVGLGRSIGALYGTHPPTVALMLESAHLAGESLWPLPLFAGYRPDIDSRCADICNMATSRYGGTIHAALFLREFIKTTPWCHIDLAGPAWDYKDQTGSGFGVRSVVEFCRQVSIGRLPPPPPSS